MARVRCRHIRVILHLECPAAILHQRGHRVAGLLWRILVIGIPHRRPVEGRGRQFRQIRTGGDDRCLLLGPLVVSHHHGRSRSHAAGRAVYGLLVLRPCRWRHVVVGCVLSPFRLDERCHLLLRQVDAGRFPLSLVSALLCPGDLCRITLQQRPHGGWHLSVDAPRCRVAQHSLRLVAARYDDEAVAAVHIERMQPFQPCLDGLQGYPFLRQPRASLFVSRHHLRHEGLGRLPRLLQAHLCRLHRHADRAYQYR